MFAINVELVLCYIRRLITKNAQILTFWLGANGASNSVNKGDGMIMEGRGDYISVRILIKHYNSISSVTEERVKY